MSFRGRKCFVQVIGVIFLIGYTKLTSRCIFNQHLNEVFPIGMSLHNSINIYSISSVWKWFAPSWILLSSVKQHRNIYILCLEPAKIPVSLCGYVALKDHLWSEPRILIEILDWKVQQRLLSACVSARADLSLFGASMV